MNRLLIVLFLTLSCKGLVQEKQEDLDLELRSKKYSAVGLETRKVQYFDSLGQLRKERILWNNIMRYNKKWGLNGSLIEECITIDIDTAYVQDSLSSDVVERITLSQNCLEYNGSGEIIYEVIYREGKEESRTLVQNVVSQTNW